MEVSKPLILNKDGAPQMLQVSTEANFVSNQATIRYSSVDPTGKELEFHAECIVAFEDKATWTEQWTSNNYLINGRIETLKGMVSCGKADQVSRKMAYKLFASLVNYAPKYQGMEEIVFDSGKFEATARVTFQTQESDGSYLINPFWIDSLAHLSGFILNGSDATDSKNFVYISHGWRSMRLARTLDRKTTYTSYVKMQAAPNNVMAGDVYILEGEEVIGVVGGLKFQRIPRHVLDTFLPPASTAPTVARATSTKSQVPSIVKPKSTVTPPRPKPVRQTPAAPTPARGIVEAVMAIIAEETNIDLSELVDPAEWEGLGVDSLLSLQIGGKLREALDIDLPGGTFLSSPTVGDFKKYLSTFVTNSTSSSSSSSDDGFDSIEDAASDFSFESVEIPTPASEPASDSAQDIMAKIRTTISEQMGVPVEEISDTVDLHSLGVDSLMAICILGVLREELDLKLPSSLFIDHPSIEAIGEFLGLKASKSKPILPTKPRKAKPDASPERTSPAPSQRASSVLLQGTRHASKKLFLIPDGSGSPTSYAHIPALDPDIAVYGLNSPYIPNTAAFSIPEIASSYLIEIRRRQANGPYHLGGWSAGGIIAYEAIIQLFQAGEQVPTLILFDSPCPIGLEALPPLLHDYFADVGLLGDGKNKIPDWLIPHFSHTIAALSAYKPVPLPRGCQPPRTMAIWARHGVCRYPGKDPRPEKLPNEPKSMTWLLDNRTDFGKNGWEKLLGDKGVFEIGKVDGNHFTIMRDDKQVSLQSFNPL